MDKGKKPVDPVLSEEERRMLEAMREFEIITREYLALMERMSEWLEDPEGDVASAAALQARATELSDTMRRFVRQLDLDDNDDDDSTSGSSGSSGLTDLESEDDAPADHPMPDDECSSSSP